MKNTIIKAKKEDFGEREYTVKVRLPHGANELPGECGNLEDLIAIGLFPIRQMVDVLDETIGDSVERQTESVLVEQIRRLLVDLEEALYRYDKGVMWNVPPELEEVFEKIESIPREKLGEVHKAIEPFLLGDPEQKAA